MRGTQRVKRVINKFSSLVNELEKGAVEIDEEIDFNTSTIAGLQAKNTSLSGTVTTARTVAENLRKIIDG